MATLPAETPINRRIDNMAEHAVEAPGSPATLPADNAPARAGLSLFNRDVLLALSTAARCADLQMLEQLNVPAEMIPQLRQLTLEALDYAAGYKGPLLEITISSDAIQLCLDGALRHATEEQLIDEAISLGMRLSLLRRLTGLSRREYDKRCQVLGCAARPPGRVARLSEDEEVAIYGAWRRCEDSGVYDSTLAVLVAVARDTGIRLDQVAQSLIDDQEILLR